MECSAACACLCCSSPAVKPALWKCSSSLNGPSGGGLQVEGVWGKDVTVVLAGLTNTYSSYVTTFEEYAMQRYEGASTIFGPHTLDAYIQVCAPACRDSAALPCRLCELSLNCDVCTGMGRIPEVS